MNKNIYITTPIYYVNGDPHIGHFYTSLATDMLVRFYQMLGCNVRMLTGTDEHGQKVADSAKKNGITPKEFCDIVSAKFKNLNKDFKMIHSQNDFNGGKNFIRTTDEKHIKYVQKVWEILQENGWIYKGNYEGWYSVRDEAFYTESELVGGKAPTGAEVEKRMEEAYFFRLSLFQKVIIELYTKYDILAPESSKTEILSFVGGKQIADVLNGNIDEFCLKDLCISRQKIKCEWGIEVPTDKNHVMYVWLDALFNYFSALDGHESEEFNQFWKNCHSIHIIGKEIARFHAVYWPAFIYGLYHKSGIFDINHTTTIDDYKQFSSNISVKDIFEVAPKTIFAHGWWVKDGQKMSKSIGNVVNPYDEIKWLESQCLSKDTAIDYIRYYLFASTPFGNDGNYLRELFVNTVNADLANNLGNLVNRITSMLWKNFDNQELSKVASMLEKYEEIDVSGEIEKIQFSAIIAKAMAEASKLNQEFNDLAPWKTMKENKQKAFEILTSFLPRIRAVLEILQPVCPYITSVLEENLKLQNEPKIACLRIENKD